MVFKIRADRQTLPRTAPLEDHAKLAVEKGIAPYELKRGDGAQVSQIRLLKDFVARETVSLQCRL
jgi:hypothetical protein